MKKKNKIRKCNHCESEFSAYKNQKYCSDDCKDIAVKLSRKKYLDKFLGDENEIECNQCGLVKEKRDFYTYSKICKKCLLSNGKKNYKVDKEDNERARFIKVTEFLYELKWKKRFYLGLNDIFKAMEVFFLTKKQTDMIDDCEDVNYMIQEILDWWLARKQKYLNLTIELEKKWIMKKEESASGLLNFIKCNVCKIQKLKDDFRHIRRINKKTNKEFIQILGYCKKCENEKQRLRKFKND